MALFLGGCAATEAPIDFRTLARSERPHDALACRPGLCAARIDLESPVFPRPADAVLAAAKRAIARAPRTELARDNGAAGQLVYVQRSGVFRFPDTVWLQVFPLGPDESTVGLYSKSNYGYYDLGVNLSRVERWLEAIAAELGVAWRAPAPG